MAAPHPKGRNVFSHFLAQFNSRSNCNNGRLEGFDFGLVVQNYFSRTNTTFVFIPALIEIKGLRINFESL